MKPKTKKIINPDGSIKEPYYFYSEYSGTRRIMLEPKPNTLLVLLSHLFIKMVNI